MNQSCIISILRSSFVLFILLFLLPKTASRPCRSKWGNSFFLLQTFEREAFIEGRERMSGTIKLFTPEPIVMKKFLHSGVVLHWNEALWLAVPSPMTIFSQLECFISESRSSATLKFFYDIGSWTHCLEEMKHSDWLKKNHVNCNILLGAKRIRTWVCAIT